MNDVVFHRHNEAPEQLINLGHGNARGGCNHCEDGIVCVMRDQKTFKLLWDCGYCLNCGQRYFVLVEDRERYLGYDPNLEPF